VTCAASKKRIKLISKAGRQSVERGQRGLSGSGLAKRQRGAHFYLFKFSPPSRKLVSWDQTAKSPAGWASTCVCPSVRFIGRRDLSWKYLGCRLRAIVCFQSSDTFGWWPSPGCESTASPLFYLEAREFINSYSIAAATIILHQQQAHQKTAVQDPTQNATGSNPKSQSIQFFLPKASGSHLQFLNM